MKATGVCADLRSLVFAGNHPQFSWKGWRVWWVLPINELLLLGFRGVGDGASMELSTGGGAEVFSMSPCPFLKTLTHQLSTKKKTSFGAFSCHRAFLMFIHSRSVFALFWVHY